MVQPFLLCPEPEIRLDTKETLYRISQEAIHNIIKHAQASEVVLRLECTGSQVCLEVSDNGRGFDPSADYPGHLGLQSMRERAARGMGKIEIDSTPGRGTKIQLIIPLN